MKKLFFFILLIGSMKLLFAQNDWRLSGNSNVIDQDFLGTTNTRPIIFKTNNIERGTLFGGGLWRFGTADNNGAVLNSLGIDQNGNLFFGGAATYIVNPNRYVFRAANYGLYFHFNPSVHRYEFRNSTAAPVFYVDADNGNGVFNGTLKVGAYTLPSTDGLSGQVLKTNGSGGVSWSNDLNSGGGGANVFLSNLSSPTAVNQSLLPGVNNSIDLGTSSFSWKDVYFGGSLNLNAQRFISAPGLNNIAIGYNALNPASTGNGNIAFGEQALMSNTTGEWNTAIGYQTLASNTTGNYNNAVGYHALRYNNSGNNDAFGTQALENNTTGGANTAIGTVALWQNTTGSHNVAIGVSALGSNTTAPGNTAVGRNTMGANIDGWQNTSVGYESLLLNTTGARNCVIGANAFTSNISGSINIGIGVQADVTAPDLVNAIAIGTTALVDASDKVRIGNTNITSIGGEVSWTTFSDARYKRNMKENVPGLAFINSLTPITYTVDINALNGHYLKNDKTKTTENSKIKAQEFKEDAALQKLNARIKQSVEEATKIVYTGFAAQEVEAAAKKLNYEFSGVDKPKTENGLYGLRYSDFVVPLVKSVQEVSADLKNKDEKIADQQKQIDELKQQLKEITEMLSKSGVQVLKTKAQTALLSSAVLEQNAPNPFSRVTTIRYELPSSFSSAKVVVTDKSGKLLKQINVSGAGKGMVNIDASTLTAGIYDYSLYVDGKLIASKQMVLTK